MLKLYVGDAVSSSWQFSKSDLIKIAKVIIWSCVSALVATLITILPHLSFSAQWLWLVPLINSALMAIYQFVKKEQDNNPIPTDTPTL